MQHTTNLSSIFSPYDALLLDLWGCVHDGTELYPGAKECLVALRGSGKKILFLSNAPRRAAKAQAVLDELGVARGFYDAILTSGEAGRALMARDAWALGKRYYFIGVPRDADVLDGLGYVPVELPDDADFLLVTGYGGEGQSPEQIDALLREAHRRAQPMLCLNPDLEVVKISGERQPCAGVIGRDFERIGGRVILVGKPWPEIYVQALEMLGGIDKAKVLAVGDGLHTDILGARNAGIASVYVTGGIFSHEGRDPSPRQVEAFIARERIVPDYVIPALRW
jgi:HAD superfamily hydrolase (TIGR01459 family)